MGRVQPLFAGEAKAAKLLDMTASEFRELVNDGVLPKPSRIGDFERWDVEQLQFVARGEAAEGGPIEW